MKKNVLLFAVAIVPALAGGQSMPPASTPPPAGKAIVATASTKVDCADETADSCVVKVDVRGCDTKCYLTVSDDLVVITGKKKVAITWLLNDSSYKWDKKLGIVIHGDKKNDFKCSPDPKDDAKFVCTNKHSEFGAYKYTVQVIGVDPLDPWIIND